MRVLGLDVAISTGWALVEDGALVAHGVFKLRGNDGRRYADAWEQACDLFDEHKPDLVAYEQVGFSKFYLAYGSFRAISSAYLMAAHDYDLPTVGVGTGPLKKFWTGSGRASKADMCKMARTFGAVLFAEEEGGCKSHEDQADAIAVAFWGATTGLPKKKKTSKKTSVTAKRKR